MGVTLKSYGYKYINVNFIYRHFLSKVRVTTIRLYCFKTGIACKNNYEKSTRSVADITFHSYTPI
jgi:hypothetical protein